MVLAAFFGLSSFVTGEPIAGVEFVAALAILKFIVRPWQLENDWKVEAWGLYGLAVVLLGAAAIQYAWNLPTVEARYAAEQQAAQQESRYHAAIAADVFKPLPPTGWYWSRLSSQWAFVNEYRVKAAKAAIDRKQCEKVSSSYLLQADPLVFKVSCEDGTQFAFGVQAIDDGSNGNALTVPEDRGDEAHAEAQADMPVRAATMDLATSQVMSKRQLEGVLLDANSVRYQNVLAHSATDHGVSFFAFCGEANGKNTFGGYTGYQRFVATPWVATTEGATVGFDEIWQKLCFGPSSNVWF
jgi:hypothetical protein